MVSKLRWSCINLCTIKFILFYFIPFHSILTQTIAERSYLWLRKSCRWNKFSIISCENCVDTTNLIWGVMIWYQWWKPAVLTLLSPNRFDNFLNVKCPDDSVLRTVIRKPWWQKPTPVQGETDPRIAGTHLFPYCILIISLIF